MSSSCSSRCNQDSHESYQQRTAQPTHQQANNETKPRATPRNKRFNSNKWRGAGNHNKPKFNKHTNNNRETRENE
jgi:hypothetical protein